MRSCPRPLRPQLRVHRPVPPRPAGSPGRFGRQQPPGIGQESPPAREVFGLFARACGRVLSSVPGSGQHASARLLSTGTPRVRGLILPCSTGSRPAPDGVGMPRAVRAAAVKPHLIRKARNCHAVRLLACARPGGGGQGQSSKPTPHVVWEGQGQ